MGDKNSTDISDLVEKLIVCEIEGDSLYMVDSEDNVYHVRNKGDFVLHGIVRECDGDFMSVELRGDGIEGYATLNGALLVDNGNIKGNNYGGIENYFLNRYLAPVSLEEIGTEDKLDVGNVSYLNLLKEKSERMLDSKRANMLLEGDSYVAILRTDYVKMMD